MPDGGVDGSCEVGRLQGVLSLPSGWLPVSGAAVYAQPFGRMEEPPPLPVSGACGQCFDAARAGAATETRADGSFLLTLAPGKHRITFTKGGFVRVVDVEMGCGTTALPPESTRLPAVSSGADVAPRMALIHGIHDPVERVLARMGLGEMDGEQLVSDVVSTYRWFPDFAPQTEALLRSPTALGELDVLLVPCGAYLEGFSPAPETPPLPGSRLLDDAEIVANLRAFVEGGGRVYSTDLSYDLVERIAPSQLTFEPAGMPATDEPEPFDAAEVGNPQWVEARIVDSDLEAWLSAREMLEGPELLLEGLEEQWAVPRSAPDEATVWVTHTFDEVSRPAAVTLTLGCGRVVFSSFHVATDATSNASADARAEILAYLLLDVGACVEDPILF